LVAFQPVDAAQDGRLAGAGRTDHANHFALGDRSGKATDDMMGAKTLVNVVQLDHGRLRAFRARDAPDDRPNRTGLPRSRDDMGLYFSVDRADPETGFDGGCRRVRRLVEAAWVARLDFVAQRGPLAEADGRLTR